MNDIDIEMSITNITRQLSNSNRHSNIPKTSQSSSSSDDDHTHQNHFPYSTMGHLLEDL